MTELRQSLGFIRARFVAQLKGRLRRREGFRIRGSRGFFNAFERPRGFRAQTLQDALRGMAASKGLLFDPQGAWMNGVHRQACARCVLKLRQWLAESLCH